MYLGFNIRYDRECIDQLLPIEEWDDLDAHEAIDKGAPGIERVGPAPITDEIDDREVAITDEPALRAWIEKRLTPDEWDALRGTEPPTTDAEIRNYNRTKL
jgi:hypothetical protein